MKVEWVEVLPPGRFHLRVGLGRKASGWYYTPHSFVRSLVQPIIESRFNRDNPHGPAQRALAGLVDLGGGLAQDPVGEGAHDQRIGLGLFGGEGNFYGVLVLLTVVVYKEKNATFSVHSYVADARRWEGVVAALSLARLPYRKLLTRRLARF